MTSIKVKFRPSSVNGREGTVYYQIIHERKVRQIVTGYRIYPTEWDEGRATVIPGKDSSRNRVLMTIRENIIRDVERLHRILRKLEDRPMPFTAGDIADEFISYARNYSLVNFMENAISRLMLNGKVRTAETYQVTLNSFRKFMASRSGLPAESEDMMLDNLNSEIMEAYEAWQRARGISPNTISFYTRILRAVYNRAVEEEIIENRYPFRHVYTGIGKTVKRALPLSVIRKIKSVDLSLTPSLDFARDMFIMSFCLRGMSFIDMAFLRKSDLRNGHIVYRRRKTGQQLVIAWTGEMQAILAKYPENESDYLLPIIRTPGQNERAVYRNMSYNINRNLNIFARQLKLDMRLTMYVARHSWASAAKTKGIPVTVISEGLGHDNEATTRIYLSSLDTSVVDRANSIILRALR